MREGSRLRSGSHEAPPISSPALESPCASCAGFDQNPASKGAVEMPSAAVSLRGQRRPENVTIEEGKQLKGMSQALLTSHSAPSCLSCLLHSPSLFSTQQSMSFHNINQIICMTEGFISNNIFLSSKSKLLTMSFYFISPATFPLLSILSCVSQAHASLGLCLHSPCVE